MGYEFLRQLADSWGLLYLFILFLAVVLINFRPGSTKAAKDAANIPFREEGSTDE